MDPYGPESFRKIQEGSLQSARRVLPHLFELVPPRSIVDVGCGVGTWLKAAAERRGARHAGLDGEYVDRALLHIPQEHFTAVDLTQSFDSSTFDLALSLEVAEHLPGERRVLHRIADAPCAGRVVFCCHPEAVGGASREPAMAMLVGRALFNRRGYTAVDGIRPRIWNDSQVEWWYAQNILLMVRDDFLAASERLQHAHAAGAGPHDLVHPRAYLDRLAAAEQRRPRGPVEWLSMAPEIASATLRRWLGRADKL